jgi:hypothetical protein
MAGPSFVAMAGGLAGDPEAGALFRRLWLDRALRILEARASVIPVSEITVPPTPTG